MEHYTTNTTIGLIYMCAFLMITCSCKPHATRFSSHIRVATPTVTYSHGVGDPVPSFRPIFNRLQHPSSSTGFHGFVPEKKPYFRNFDHVREYHTPPPQNIHYEDDSFQGYPRYRPSIPFHETGIQQGNSIVQQPQPQNNNYQLPSQLSGHKPFYTVPVLPQSPYKVDSPDPESNWPEGLYLTPQIPIRYGFNDKNDQHSGYHNGGYETNSIVDPHYLDGLDAIRAVEQLNAHGELFHHEIPHVRAILANQQLRAANGLTLNRLGSIRHSSPWFRE